MFWFVPYFRPSTLPSVCSQNGIGILAAGGLGGYVFLKNRDTARAETAFQCVPKQSVIAIDFVRKPASVTLTSAAVAKHSKTHTLADQWLMASAGSR